MWGLLLIGQPCFALTANKVWFEFRPGYYRVIVSYTVPELRQVREAVVEFRKKTEAESVYFSLLRGAEFYLAPPNTIAFINPEESKPW
jgi:hypothetical protein